jgi:hypothetical protein
LSIAVFVWLGVLASVVYLVVPALGAFFVRARWRGFRVLAAEASRYPEITYREVHARSGEKEASCHWYFLGALEAFQDDEIIWLRNSNIALSADMKGQKVFLLPSRTDQSEAPAGEAIQVIPWEKVRSLPEGTQVMIAGNLHIEGRKGRFRAGKGSELLIIFYDGDSSSLLRRAVLHGRQRNEYWNLFTPACLAAGFLSGMILAYVFLHSPVERIPAILSLGISFVPFIPVLPPGLAFFVLYRRLWKKGRVLRAERDILRLPPGGFGASPEHITSDPLRAGLCEKRAVRCEVAALALFAAGFLGNAYLVLRLLAWIVR